MVNVLINYTRERSLNFIPFAIDISRNKTSFDEFLEFIKSDDNVKKFKDNDVKVYPYIRSVESFLIKRAIELIRDGYDIQKIRNVKLNEMHYNLIKFYNRILDIDSFYKFLHFFLDFILNVEIMNVEKVEIKEMKIDKVSAKIYYYPIEKELLNNEIMFCSYGNFLICKSSISLGDFEFASGIVDYPREEILGLKIIHYRSLSLVSMLS